MAWLSDCLETKGEEEDASLNSTVSSAQGRSFWQELCRPATLVRVYLACAAYVYAHAAWHNTHDYDDYEGYVGIAGPDWFAYSVVIAAVGVNAGVNAFFWWTGIR